jgi:IS4 transposase
MVLDAVFDRFIEHSPVAVMVRGLLENVFDSKAINALFDQHAEKQYTRELLFSDIVDVMGEVVIGSQPSLNASFRARREQLGVTRSAFYQKVNGVEPHVSAALTRQTAAKLASVIDQLGGALPALLPGYRVKILDGNCLAKTEHRLKELRTLAAGPLPGKSLVVLDAASTLVVDVFPCLDGHTQERALLDQVLPTIARKEVWVADRNFCTLKFLFGVAAREACFVIREHQNLPWQAVTDLEYAGACENGEVWEQRIQLEHPDTGVKLLVRRVEIRLRSATRDGDRVIVVLSNLPSRDASTRQIADLYRQRWTIEGAFQLLESTVASEQPRLGYPQAGLFAFCVALVAYNVLAVVRAALRVLHGRELEAEVSTYYLANEIKGVYQGMMIALPELDWECFRTMSLTELVAVLKDAASRANLARYKRSRRGPKKPKPVRVHCKNQPHVSTARLLANRKNKKKQSP